MFPELLEELILIHPNTAIPWSGLRLRGVSILLIDPSSADSRGFKRSINIY
jgi:hypothetical protein